VSPCMSRLGELGSPERDLQILGLFYARQYCTKNPLRPQLTPIQLDNFTITE